MTVRHLDLLRSAPQPPARPPELSPGLAAGVMLALLAVAALLAWTSQRDEALLRDRLAAAQARVGAVGAATGAPIDAGVLAALRREVQGRETLVTALTGERPVAGVEGGGAATPSQWLAALADTGATGVSIDTVRLEPGARLAITGSALQPADVNALVERLQGHALTGRVAIGQLEMQAADKPGEAPVRFSLVPAGTGPGTTR